MRCIANTTAPQVVRQCIEMTAPDAFGAVACSAAAVAKHCYCHACLRGLSAVFPRDQDSPAEQEEQDGLNSKVLLLSN